MKKQEKCGKDEVLKLVKDSLDEEITKKTCEKLLESLSQSLSINLNATGNKKGQSLPKENQTSAEVDKKKEILNVGEELENLKIKLMKEFKNLKNSLFAGVQI